MSAISNSSAHILIIWDDIDIQNLFLYLLKSPDYIVETAASFDEGLALITNKHPDLLITLSRINFKDDGFEFCEQIRADPKIRFFPIIIGWADVSGLSAQQSIQKSFEVGANACFGRVFDISDIIPLITTLLENPTLTKLADRQTMKFAQKA
jgi:CheY-like chemotaxis protein